MRTIFFLLAMVSLLVTPLEAPEPQAGEVYSPRHLPVWVVVCNVEAVSVRGAPFPEAVPVGHLHKDERVLAAEVWQGDTYVYQVGWVDSGVLCKTWQPEGW